MKRFMGITLAFLLSLTLVTPAGANYSDPSHEMTGVKRVHELGYLGAGTTIAFIDQGVNLDHPDFAGKVVDGYCAFSTPVCPNGQTEMTGVAAASQRKENGILVEFEDHGNMVAGIGAGVPSALSPGGVAPQANILMANTDLTGTSILKALEYIKSVVKKHNIVAVSMSFGGGSPIAKREWLLCDKNPFISDMSRVLKEIRDLGAIPFAASGNSPILDSDMSSFPSCLSNVVSVGSVDERGEVSLYVTMSKKVKLLAPDFTLAPATNGHRIASGTSAATPFVAGSYALLRGAFPSISPEKALEVLVNSGKPVDDVIVKRIPLVDLPAAFQKASDSPQDFVACTNPRVTNVKPSLFRGETYLKITIDPKCTGIARVMWGSVRINNDLELAQQKEISKRTTMTIKLPKSEDFLDSKFYIFVTMNGVKIWERDYLEDCKTTYKFLSQSGSTERGRLTTTCPGVFTVTLNEKTILSKVVNKSAVVSFRSPPNARMGIRFMNYEMISWGSN